MTAAAPPPGAKPDETPPAAPLGPEAMAAQALAQPIMPERGVRCPRCGQRQPGPGDAPPILAPGAAPPAPLPPGTCTRCRVQLSSAEAGLLLVATDTWFWELLRGASYVPRGLFRIVRSPSLWKWAVVPFILNVIAIVLSFLLAGWISSWLTRQTGAGALSTWEAAGGLWWALSYVVWALGWVASKLIWVVAPLISTWLIVAFPFSIVYKALFMPFMELLTESTERIVLRFDEDAPIDFARIYANLVVAIVDAILLTLTQGLLYLLLLPINLIPFLGSVLWVALPPAIFAGMDYTDINLVRRAYTTREKLRLWRAHEWRFLGYGLAFFFFITLPIVNAFVIPAAAVGGALLYLGLPRK